MIAKIVLLVILVTIPFAQLDACAEKIYAVDLDCVSQEFNTGYYWPSIDEVYKLILSKVEEYDKEKVIVSCLPYINHEELGWAVAALFPDDDKGMMRGYYDIVNGYDIGAFCSGAWCDVCTIEEYNSYASKYSLVKQKTDAWMNKYGPWQLWDYTIKAEFYSRFHCKPVDEPFFFEWYNEFFRNMECGLPDEEHPYEMARLAVEKALCETYGILPEQIQQLGLDARYILHKSTNTHGHWVFAYWIKLKKDNELYWARLCEAQLDEDGSATVCEGASPELMSLLLTYSDSMLVR